MADQLRAQLTDYLNKSPFDKYLFSALTLQDRSVGTQSEPEAVTFTLDITEQHCDSQGLLHTGVFSSLADLAPSTLLYSLLGRVGLVSDLHVQFMAPVKKVNHSFKNNNPNS